MSSIRSPPMASYFETYSSNGNDQASTSYQPYIPKQALNIRKSTRQSSSKPLKIKPAQPVESNSLHSTRLPRRRLCTTPEEEEEASATTPDDLRSANIVRSPVANSLSALGITASPPRLRDASRKPHPSTHMSYSESPQRHSKDRPPAIILSIDEIVDKHGPLISDKGKRSANNSPPVPKIPQRFLQEKQPILSIDEIVKQHKSELSISPAAKGRASSAPPEAFPSHVRESSQRSIESSRSSLDSITGEAQRLSQTSARPTASLQHSKSSPSLSIPRSGSRLRKSSDWQTSESLSSSLSSATSVAGGTSSILSSPSLRSSSQHHSQYLRSPRLTRLLTLRNGLNAHLVVSLADVGDQYGHAVVIFLGLGCVRYLVALYDEIATSLGLRLICIDRWGLGKTTDVAESRRGFYEWSSVVEEVLDQLEIERFSILAHSAGSPYALATALRLESRVHGSIHLLAPWVLNSSENTAGSYKWLRYVPSSFIKTAQAAEWKLQGWKLGKAPKSPISPIGFDPRAPISSAALSPTLQQFQCQAIIDDEDVNEDAYTSASFPRLPLESPIPVSASFNSIDSISTSTSRDLPLSRKHSLKQVGTRIRKVSTTWDRSRESLSTKPLSALSPTFERRSNTEVTSDRDQETSLGTALLRASHAESLRGGTADLLAILERTSKTCGFSYSDIERPTKVWHGLKDEKIPLASVQTLEKTMKDCKVSVIPGADHSLMTNVPVMVQVLNSILAECS